MHLHCLIIDDEKLARELLEEYIAKIPELHLCGSFSSPLAAQTTLNSHTIDLIFLDIQMPHFSGIDFLKTLRNPPMVVFTTAYSEHAIEAFQLDVVDYLLKPIVFERFFQAISKVLSNFSKQKNEPKIVVNNNTSTNSNSISDFIFVKADNLIHKIFPKDILYIESLREYTRIHTSQQRIVIRQALSKLIDQLPQDNFIRIHRSYIINLEHIENIEGNMVRIAGETLPISKRKKEEFIAFIQKKGFIG